MEISRSIIWYLFLTEVVDCIDNIHSKIEEFDCLSTLVLDEPKIPQSCRWILFKKVGINMAFIKALSMRI